MAAAFVGSKTGRKRARPSSPAAFTSPQHASTQPTTPWTNKSGASVSLYGSSTAIRHEGNDDDDFEFADAAFSPDPHAFNFSPAPLASSRYRMAAGHESPISSQSYFPHDASSLLYSTSQSLSDVSFRRGRPYHNEGSAGSFARDPGASSTEALPTALAREANGRPRAVSSAAYLAGPDETGGGGMGQALYGAFSGVVGRVWDFCTAGSFKGFFAGGGTGYNLKLSDEIAQDAAQWSHTEHQGNWHDFNASAHTTGRAIRERLPRDRNVSARHVPGGFPASSSPPRPKTPPVDGLNGSWTATEDEAEHRPGSGPRRASKRSRHSYADSSSNVYASPAASWVLVPDVSASSAGRSHITQYQRGASPAPVRRSTSRASLRRSNASQLQEPQQQQQQHGSSRLSLAGVTAATGEGKGSSGHARRASAAGLRSPRASPAHSRQNSAIKEKRVSLAPTNRQGDSPIAVETARFVKDMKKAEKREDREISRMNRTLQDMIREAKQALGTTVEVEMDDADVDVW